MSTINDDPQASSMPDKIDSGLTAKSKPKKSTVVLSKSDSRYWLEKGRLFKNHGAADYSCRFTALKRREHFSLGSSNRRTAAAKAAEIYSFIQAQGWEATLERYKPSMADAIEETTVGMLIKEASRLSSARQQSLNAYTKAFRRIVSEIKGIKVQRKLKSSGGGIAEWHDLVDAVSLSAITPTVITAWKNQRLREVEADPLAKRRTIVTVNSLIRNSKALFNKKILPFIEQVIELPHPLPFEGVTMEKSPSMRYVSKLDPYALLASAKNDLAETNPEAFKIIILALVCGLRRSEIDNLLWRSFDFTNSLLRVETTEYHQLKSEDSSGEIDLDVDTLALFQRYRARNPTSLFVIESKAPARNPMNSRYYRCNAVFKEVLTWLRDQGVDSSKPLHTLRKEIGSVIASEHGIFEASRYLRHSDIRITSAIYADKKKAVTPKTFSGLLGNADKSGGGNSTDTSEPD